MAHITEEIRRRKIPADYVRGPGSGSAGLGSGIAAFLSGAPDAVAGVHVDEYNCITLSGVWNAIRILSEGIGTADWQLIDEMNDEMIPLMDDPAYHLVNRHPNPEMTPISFKTTLMAHVNTWGNAYAEIERDGAGRPINLWPITPNRVYPWRDVHAEEGRRPGQLYYKVVQPDGGVVALDLVDMFHVPGLAFDGIVGYSPISLARVSLGIPLAAETYGASWFGNGAIPSGILEHPLELSDTARENIKKTWNELHQGPRRANRIAILEEGMKYTRIGLPPGDAQFLEARKFGIADIARWFNVPIHMLKELGETTRNNIETLGDEFVRYSLRPWATKFNQEAKRKLLGRNTKYRASFWFDFSELLAPGQAERFRIYGIARQWGIMNAAEARKREKMPKAKGPGSETVDTYYMPTNMGGDLKPQADPQLDSAKGGEQS